MPSTCCALAAPAGSRVVSVDAGSPARCEVVWMVVPEGLEVVDCVKVLPLESLLEE